jgi:hypothetical protein
MRLKGDGFTDKSYYDPEKWPKSILYHIPSKTDGSGNTEAGPTSNKNSSSVKNTEASPNSVGVMLKPDRQAIAPASR